MASDTPSNSRTALVVDDSPTMRAYLGVALQARGYDVTECGSAEEAWDLFLSEYYQIILLDLMLPGMDGLELCRRIRASERGEHVAIVIVTGREEAGDFEAIMEAGADDYLPKSMDTELLAVRLRIAEQHAQDHTLRMRARDEMHRATQHAKSLVELSPSAIFTVDLDRRIQAWNRRAEEITGYAPQEMIGRECTLFARYPCTDRCGLFSGEVLKPVFGSECVIETRDGGRRIIAKNVDVLRDERGQISGGIETFEDITERERAVRTLRRAHDRMKRDLDAAARTQRSLLPLQFVRYGGVDIAYRFRPCDELAGDMLNVVPVDERYVRVYVLDVSGHGVESALHSVTLNHLLVASRQGQSADEMLVCTEPCEVATALNVQFQLDGNGQYFTLLYGIIDTTERTFRYVCAGHPGPVYVPKLGSARILDTPSYPIGFVSDPCYEEETIALHVGDRLYLCTDGIKEAFDEDGRLFGNEGVLRSTEAGRTADLDGSLRQVIDAVAAHCGNLGASDDIALLGIELGAG